MLDELIGRVLWIKEPESLAVTTTITVKYRRPMPIGVQLRGVARLTQDSTRGFVGIGEIYDPNGKLLAAAEGTYMRLSNETIGDFDIHEEMKYLIDDNVTEIE